MATLPLRRLAVAALASTLLYCSDDAGVSSYPDVEQDVTDTTDVVDVTDDTDASDVADIALDIADVIDVDDILVDTPPDVPDDVPDDVPADVPEDSDTDVSPPEPAVVLTLDQEVGELGTGPGEFDRAADIAVHRDGTVFVCDPLNDRVQRFAADGTFEGEFHHQNPTDIDLDATGRVFVWGNWALQQYDQFGAAVPGFRGINYSTILNGNNHFAVSPLLNEMALVNISGMAQRLDPIELLVDDVEQHHVLLTQATSGALTALIGEPGSGDGGFTRPYTVAYDHRGLLHVLDVDARRIQVFSDGDFVEVLPLHPDVGFGTGFTIDHEGRLYLRNGNTIEVTEPDGRVSATVTTDYDGADLVDGNYLDTWYDEATDQLYLYTVGRAGYRRYAVAFEDWAPTVSGTPTLELTEVFESGELGSAPGQFDEVADIAIDSAGYVYVCDFLNDRVQKLSPSGEFELEWEHEGAQDIEIAPDDTVYVWGRSRLVRYEGDGTPIPTYDGVGFSTVVNSDSHFAVSPVGDEVASLNISGDAHTLRTVALLAESMERYNLLLTTRIGARRIRTFGALGDDPGEFDHPWSTDYDHRGILWVTDNEDTRVQAFRAGYYVGELPFALETHMGTGFAVHGDRAYVRDGDRLRVYAMDGSAWAEAPLDYTPHTYTLSDYVQPWYDDVGEQLYVFTTSRSAVHKWRVDFDGW